MFLEIVKVLNIHTLAFVKEISASQETEVKRDVGSTTTKTFSLNQMAEYFDHCLRHQLNICES